MKKKQRNKRDPEREAKMLVKFSKKPKLVKGFKTWYGNKGAYKVTESLLDTSFHAGVRKVRENGVVWYDFVEEHVRFKNLITAMLACNNHYKDQKCPSTNTPALAETKSKNSKTIRRILTSVLSAASPTASSDNSPKSESPRLEALLSRNTRGESAKGVATSPRDPQLLSRSVHGPLSSIDLRRLADVCQCSRLSVESAMNMAGLSVDDYDPTLVASQLLNLNAEQCLGYWHDSGELVDDDHEPGFCYECRSNMRG